ncbi:MAG: apolipoprotein N-acyltransferase [Acidobacteriota bacterium]|nr:apolipoprotein N-acyltransferase [Acidobacteriota bacterium]
MRKQDWRSSVWTLPALSGVVLALAYFPFDLLLPNLFAFLPMLYWLDQNATIWRWQRFRACLIFGLTVHLIILHWMWAMLDISWLWIGAYFFTASMLALSNAVSLTLAGWIRARTGWTYAVLLPICWLPIEWLKTCGDSRMTADNLAHTLAGYPFLVQFADLLGPYGVGAFMLIVNASLYETIFPGTRGRLRSAGTLLVLGLAVLGYDAWAWTRPLPTAGTVRVAVIQPNFPLEIKHDEETTLYQWETLVEMTRQAAKEAPDLIVWPESAHPMPIRHWLDRADTFEAPLLQNLAREVGSAIITGVEYARARSREDFAWYNAAVIVHSDGTLDETWTAKTYLVPFTEQVPYEGVLGPLLSGRSEGELRWLSGGFARPETIRPLPFEKGPVGVLVCYEELYWDLARHLRNDGAVLEAVITNDAWFKQTKFQDYQADTVRLRAIENRSSFVRAANTGISGFVDPRGRYHARTALDVRAVKVAELPIVTTRTVYDRIGDVVAWIAIAGLIAAVFLARARERKP